MDIGIIVRRFDGDYFAVLKQLYVLRREVDLRIEPHLIIEDSDPLGFSYEVTQTGIRL